MEKKMICGVDEAVRRVGFLLHHFEGKALKKVADLNRGRYKLLYVDDDVVMVVFKKEHFISFNKQFDVSAGHGESINKVDLKIAVSKGVKRVFFVYPNEFVYMIPVALILDKGFIRTTNNEDKETYSFDIKLLLRFDKSKIQGKIECLC